jgi:hypothetical protein
MASADAWQQTKGARSSKEASASALALRLDAPEASTYHADVL